MDDDQRAALEPCCSGPQHERNVGNEMQRMMEQEAALYTCKDHASLRNSREPFNFVWREKVCQWCYDVIDHLGASRDIVYVAMNILDRFCVLESSSCIARNEKAYELAAMTGLFLALRVTRKVGFGASDITRMSRRGIKVRDIIKMGKSMIKKLSWDRRMPTPSNFVESFVDLLPRAVDDAVRRALLDAASYLVEVSVCDSFFSRFPPSKVAYAAVMNASGGDGRISEAQRLEFYNAIEATTGIHRDTPETRALRSRLHHIYAQSEGNNSSAPHIIPEGDSDDVVVRLSRPVSMRCMSDNLSTTCVRCLREASSLSSPQVICEPSPSPIVDPEQSPCTKRSISPTPPTEDNPNQVKRARTC